MFEDPPFLYFIRNGGQAEIQATKQTVTLNL